MAEKKKSENKSKTTDVKRLVQVRKTIKSKKPVFRQQDFHKKRRLAAKWKRPTGLQSKMRHQFRGYSRRVKQGWRSPAEIRGFSMSGLEMVTIFTIKDLDNIKSHQGIIISSNLGLRKKIEIMDKALQLKIPVLNIKPDKFKKKVEEQKAKKVEDKKTREDKKKKTLEESLKKAEKNKKDKEKHDKEVASSSDEEIKEEKEEEKEEKKDEEKKIKDDVLIHKQ